MNKPRQHSSKVKLLKEKALEGGLGLEKAFFKTEDHWLLPVMCTMKILRFSIWTSSGRRAIAERTVLSSRSIKATRERTFTCTSPVWTFQLLTKDWKHQKAGKWRIPCIPVMCHGSAMTNSTNHLLVAYLIVQTSMSNTLFKRFHRFTVESFLVEFYWFPFSYENYPTIPYAVVIRIFWSAI